MSVFEKLFTKKSEKGTKAPEEKNECWYNNVNEMADGKNGEPLEGAALSGSNQFEYSVAKSNSMNYIAENRKGTTQFCVVPFGD